MTWQDTVKKGQELVLATCSDTKPHANVVISLGLVDDKLLIANSQMDNTLKNLQATKKICIVAKKDREYYRIKGSVEIFDSGKYFDICNEADKDFPTKNAILVIVEEIFDLDKVKKVL